MDGEEGHVGVHFGHMNLLFSSSVSFSFDWDAKAVTSVRKELKIRKRDHPALFMLGAAGKHLYEAVQAGGLKFCGFESRGFLSRDFDSTRLDLGEDHATLSSYCMFSI